MKVGGLQLRGTVMKGGRRTEMSRVQRCTIDRLKKEVQSRKNHKGEEDWIYMIIQKQ